MMGTLYYDQHSYFDEEHVSSVLELHPADCVFELDAPRNIVQRLSGKTAGWWITPENISAFRACWIASEIYCPHEGIDRLAECGVKTLNWETA
jgi:hypothetical protein